MKIVRTQQEIDKKTKLLFSMIDNLRNYRADCFEKLDLHGIQKASWEMEELKAQLEVLKNPRQEITAPNYKYVLHLLVQDAGATEMATRVGQCRVLRARKNVLEWLLGSQKYIWT
jgi:hypothetical protein